MKFSKTTKIKASADDVWDVFAHQFDAADRWIASVPRSYGTNRGELFDGATTTGRICEFRPDGKGMKAAERFVAYDEAAKTGSIRVDFVDAPRMIPMQYLTLDFAVSYGTDGGSTGYWKFGAIMKPWAIVLQPVIRLGMAKAWSELAEELVYFVENGTPHPRKLAAIEKAKLFSDR